MTVPRFRIDDSLSTPKDTNIPKLSLKRNPFPISAVVVIDNDNEVSNGSLFNPNVRANAVKAFEEKFIDVDFDDPNHLKLGYLWSVPIGREAKGFGKTAMLAYYLRKINRNYGNDLPHRQKVAAIYAEPGTDTNDFKKLAQLLCQSLLHTDPVTRVNILSDAIRAIRYSVIQQEKYPRTLHQLTLPNFETEAGFEQLTDPTWVEKEWKFAELHTAMKGYLISSDFGFGEDIAELLAVYDDKSVYRISRWMARNPVNFLCNDMVKILQAASFKGLYVFIDDLYRGIANVSLKKGRNKFADDVRDYLISGTRSEAASKGFFTTIMTFHPGLEGKLLDSWHEAGLDRIASFSIAQNPDKNVDLGSLDREDCIELLKAYTEPAIADEKIKVENPLHPLTYETAQILIANRKISPRQLLEDGYKLIEKAKRDAQVGPLSETYVKGFAENLIKTEILFADDDEDLLDM